MRAVVAALMDNRLSRGIGIVIYKRHGSFSRIAGLREKTKSTQKNLCFAGGENQRKILTSYWLEMIYVLLTKALKLFQ